ncbi:MAG TPA: hypothetical protein VNA87_02895 [Actinomycetota bacterium]|nr:hypothetical protein [Actinomycetota bacterium]
MTVREYLQVLRRRWMVAVMIVMLSSSSAVILGLRQAPEYEAISRFMLYPQVATEGNAVAVLREKQVYKGVATQAELLKSEPVANRVIERLGLKKMDPNIRADQLISKITITPATEVLYVVVVDSNPKLARDLANVFPEVYMEVEREHILNEAIRNAEEFGKRITLLIGQLQELEASMKAISPESTRFLLLSAQRQSLLTQIASIEQQRTSLLDQSPLKSGGLGKIIQYATEPTEKKNSDPVRSAALGMMVGIPLALGLALLLEATSDTIKNREEAEKIVGAEMLGVIPLSPDWRSDTPYIVTREAPYSAAAEAYRTLRINIDSRVAGDEGKHLLFTSPGMGEGKTLSTANLAVAYAESGRSVLLVSADLRRPRLHQLFGSEPGPGLSDVINGRQTAEDVILEPSPNLYLMVSGTPEDRPDQLMSRTNFKEILGDVVVPQSRRDGTTATIRNGDGQGSYGVKAKRAANKNGELVEGRPKNVVGVQPDIVILDAPSVLGAAEVSAMAPSVHGVVLILHVGVTRRQAAARAAEQIRRAGGHIAGAVLVGVKLDNDYSIYPPADLNDETKPTNGAWPKVLSALRK